MIDRSFSIVSGTTKDLPEIVALNKEIFTGMYENDPYPLEHYQQKLKDKEYLILEAKDGDKIVGDSISFKRENTWYVWIVGVQEHYRKMGIASSFFTSNEDYAKKHGFSSVMVKVYRVSKVMLDLLGARGYVIINTEKSEINSKYYTIYLMLKLVV